MRLIKKIRNGIVETTDGRFLKILEIEPINFLLRSAEERLDIIYLFASWFKIANIKLQFKSITKKADSERHISLLKKDMQDETNAETIKMSKAYGGAAIAATQDLNDFFALEGGKYGNPCTYG